MVGKTPMLSSLFAAELPELLLSAFRLENLVDLHVEGQSVLVLMNLSRFISLSSLTVSEPDFLPKKNELPKLECLALHGFKKIDISNLVKLKSLSIGSCQVVVGKEKIYPLLKSLKGREGAFEEDDISQYKNLKSFELHDISLSTRTNCLHQYGNISDIFISDFNLGNAPVLAVGSEVISFHLTSIEDITIEMTANRKLNKIGLFFFRGLSVSFCQSAQMVELYACNQVKDISALKNVPYVKIGDCPEIEDFSCLGSQHYLELAELTELQDEDITRFDNISYLRITNCNNIISVDQLNQNKFLFFVECRQLQTVDLQSDQYLQVSFESCPELSQLTISGKVIKHAIRDCPRLQLTNVNMYHF
jgi:hypothetical protein